MLLDIVDCTTAVRDDLDSDIECARESTACGQMEAVRKNNRDIRGDVVLCFLLPDKTGFRQHFSSMRAHN
jgi:hypothetical protein